MYICWQGRIYATAANVAMEKKGLDSMHSTSRDWGTQLPVSLHLKSYLASNLSRLGYADAIFNNAV